MEQNPLKQCIYSDPGVGKTKYLGTVVEVPEMMPAVMLDFEGNTDSIESKCNYIPGLNQEGLTNLKQVAGQQNEKIDVLRLKCTDRFGVKGHVEDFSGVLAFQDVINYLLDQPHPYKSVFVDSWSAFDYWLMGWVMKEFPIKRVHPEVPDKPDYRKTLLLNNDLFRALVDAPFHVIITCQTYVSEKDPMIKPRIQGQSRTDVSGIFKQTGIMTVKPGGRTRELRFDNYGVYSAKDCTEGGLMGDVIQDPTLRKVYDLRYKK